MGPFRAVYSSATSGSFLISTIVMSASDALRMGMMRPMSGVSISAMPDARNAYSMPHAPAAWPQIPAPMANPPVSDAWNHDSARAVTQRGTDSWTPTLSSAMARILDE